MMPVVRLNDATFLDLKSIATWLGTDTPSRTIEALVREKMENLDLARDVAEEAEGSPSGEGELTFETAPVLSFTRLLAASVNGQDLTKPNWAKLMLRVIACVKAKGYTGQKLVTELQIPAQIKPYDEEGYTHHADLGISVQGQSAQDAWKEASRLAAKHGIPVEVRFQWRDNPKAQYPGRTGILRAGA